MSGSDTSALSQVLNQLFQKLINLQSDIDNLVRTTSRLAEEKEDGRKLIEDLKYQIEVLKTVKADRIDLEDMLAGKADACAINRKISHDQFYEACEELHKGIEDALTKLNQQEELWQQGFTQIQKSIGNKLEKKDLKQLRESINSRLRMLQDKFKSQGLKQETEAAGTKLYLQDVNCLSCDKKVVMRKEVDPSVYDNTYGLPPPKSLGPYLAYELDNVRKQRIFLPNSKDPNYVRSFPQGKPPSDYPVSKRYCGGSHTVTTAQQRVIRSTDFLHQWKKSNTVRNNKFEIVGTSYIQVPDELEVPKNKSEEKHEKNRRKGPTTTDSKRQVVEKRKTSIQKISESSPKDNSRDRSEHRRRLSTASIQRSKHTSRISSRSTLSTTINGSSLPTDKQIPEQSASQSKQI
ncbi:hypothetical protein Trydic_g3033 [Trypoxylus dichotomus]